MVWGDHRASYGLMYMYYESLYTYPLWCLVSGLSRSPGLMGGDGVGSGLGGVWMEVAMVLMLRGLEVGKDTMGCGGCCCRCG